MRRTIVTMFVLAIAIAMQANDYTKYYQDLPVSMTQVTLPQIPEYQVSITDFGGKGDGVTDNTEAFRKAISAINNKGGGHLVVPAGIYMTGLISLKDNMDLHLERHAIIMATPDRSQHLKTDSKTGAKENRATPLISASKRKNISITGEGTIDGNGKWWRPVKRSKVSSTEWGQFMAMGGTVVEDGSLWYPFNLKHQSNIADTYEAQERMRTHLVRITDCENVLIQGVTLQNSPKFHFVPQRCRNVIIDGITARCPWNAQMVMLSISDSARLCSLSTMSSMPVTMVSA